MHVWILWIRRYRAFARRRGGDGPLWIMRNPEFIQIGPPQRRLHRRGIALGPQLLQDLDSRIHLGFGVVPSQMSQGLEEAPVRDRVIGRCWVEHRGTQLQRAGDAHRQPVLDRKEVLYWSVDQVALFRAALHVQNAEVDAELVAV